MQDEIIKLISQYGGLSYDALLKFLKCAPDILAREIAAIENEKIYKVGKNYILIDGNRLVKGTVIYKNETFYLVSEDKRYFIDRNYWNNLYVKDEVVASIEEDFLGRTTAYITKVISHSKEPVVGKRTSRVVENMVYYTLKDPNLNYQGIWVNKRETLDSKINDLCLIEPLYQSKKLLNGKVLKVLGKDGAIGSDILSLIAQSGVSYEFSDSVIDEAENIPLEVIGEELIGRRDFTNDLVITIDGNDSKDFDDAVNVKKLANGNYLLSVHIADVSHYVKEDSDLDREALKRGNSIYLVDRVIPMLPERLSNGICSLNEGVIRLVLSCVMEIDCHGEIIDSNIYSGYIKSKYRMTYENVNKMIKGHEGLIEKYHDLYPMILDMVALSDIIRARRESCGALDFEVTETKIVVDEKGKPIDVIPRVRDKAEMLIEDFMLAANETVALTLNHLEYPCCYRVHEEPSKERLTNLQPLLASVGCKLGNIGNGVKPAVLQKVLNKIKGTSSEIALNSLLLRAMAKARYDSNCLGHYGLAMQYYCHFTSPIRRYSDLETHRIINDLIINPNANFNERLQHFNNVVGEVCLQASETEKKAVELERKVDDMKSAEYMQKFIGKIFHGVITSVTHFGMFVMLDNTIEGLVHIKNMPDYYEYDEKKMCLIGNYSKDVYNIGDHVKVRVIDANKGTGKIDFLIIEHQMRKGNKK